MSVTLATHGRISTVLEVGAAAALGIAFVDAVYAALAVLTLMS